ncbi:MAG: hypothetical protein HY698_00035 [Deltaproteobacteria bacterium]|nr:hypothetical protein [Deltaproteobacteria bacterium]
MKSALRVLTIIAFATQLLAFGGTVLVCRYTGEVLDKCCCPKALRTKALQSPVPYIIAECCCEQRDSSKADITATVERSSERAAPAPLVAVLPEHPLGALSLDASSVFEQRSIGPPHKTPLYIFERHLLI